MAVVKRKRKLVAMEEARMRRPRSRNHEGSDGSLLEGEGGGARRFLVEELVRRFGILLERRRC